MDSKTKAETNYARQEREARLAKREAKLAARRRPTAPAPAQAPLPEGYVRCACGHVEHVGRTVNANFGRVCGSYACYHRFSGED